MVFDKSRHQELIKENWSEKKALETIRDIYKNTINNFDQNTFWPTDKNESTDNESNKSIYFGASGTIWALNQISMFLNEKLSLDKKEIIKTIHEKYLSSPDTKEVNPAYFVGESGIVLIDYKFNPTKNKEDLLFNLVEANIKNPTLEFLWAAPGTMIIASHMYDVTKEKRWKELYQQNVDHLLSKLHFDKSRKFKTWTQDLYGSKKDIVGAGHGFIGNFLSILKNIDLIKQSDNEIYSLVSNFLLNTYVEENNLVNWPVTTEGQYHTKFLVQWCHGAPGIITSLIDFPTNNKKLEDILKKAGDLIWEAGPLNKNISLCHGTDGNGYAFLCLYKRTKNKVWLDRARYFAMQAIKQRNGRFSLYTGEPGLAMYLISCIKEEPGLPLIDFI